MDVLLYGGGIDSFIARQYLVDHGLPRPQDLCCLYFNHGGRYTSNELDKIEELPFPVVINNFMQFKDIETHDAFIPNRNILLATMANSFGYDKIWIGGTKSDRVNDNNEKVFERLSEFLTSVHGRYIKIDSPFWDCYKDDAVKWYVKRYDPMNLVKHTFSCYDPLPEKRETFVAIVDEKTTTVNTWFSYHTEECLMCSACFRKCAVLYSGGLLLRFANKEIIRKYEKEFENEILLNTRAERTLSYINRIPPAWMV